MKILHIIPVAILTMANLNATIIDLGPSGPVIERDCTISGLEGIPLAGQPLSLDLTFLNDQFIRIYALVTGHLSFDALLVFQTDAGTYPGFLTGGGYVTDKNGKQYSGVVGRSMGDNGTTSIGLFPFWDDLGPLPGIFFPLDIYGIHYDLTLPTTLGVQIVSSRLRLTGEIIPRVEFFTTTGIGPGIPDEIPPVPEAGSTLLLLGGSLGLLIGFKFKHAI